MRKLRCKSGDLALVIHDVPECAQNIGRVVMVRGPIEYNFAYEKYCWLIRPVTRTPYHVDLYDDTQAFIVCWKSKVEHPDSWLLPLRDDPETIISGVGSVAKSGIPLLVPAVATRPAPGLGEELERSLERLNLESLRRRFLASRE